MDNDVYESHSSAETTTKQEEKKLNYKQDEFKNSELNSEKFFENKIESVWASTKAAAAILGITPNALRIRKYRGQIECRYFGKYLRFNVSYLTTLFREERQARKD